MKSLKSLPVEGLISVSSLARFLGTRNQDLKRRLNDLKIPVYKMGVMGDHQLIDMKELRDHLKSTEAVVKV